MDGPLAAFNTVRLYNLMTRDVVNKGVPGFDEPAPATNRSGPIKLSSLKKFSFKDLGEARRLQKEVMKGAAFADPGGKLSFTSPSPVYPDMVAIPLMSMERCYGPWLSATSLDPSTGSPGVMNIGGKIEFVKDENLAPWNFAGYQLMNEAGFLQAQFSNSLLLFSERGGFVFPEAPTGIGLAKALKQGGPLVTSISVDIGTDKISTTVKMDLYTSSFGKLQKQKEGNIAQISRERQKIIDQNNSAIRRGLGKSSTNANLFGGVLANGGNNIIAQARRTEEHFSNVEKGEAMRDTYITASKKSYDHGKPLGGTLNAFGREIVGSLVNGAEEAGELMSITNEGGSIKGTTWENTALKLFGDFIRVISEEPGDDIAPSAAREKRTRD
jgi:hypothetical protein